MKYPKTIDGYYKISITEFTLMPVYLPNKDADDFKIELIWIEDANAKIIFENGYVQLLPIRYDKEENLYVIEYDGVTHCFQVQASLEGIHDYVDMKILIDFKEFMKDDE